jgi:predicted MarR family transcription regulator
MRRPVREGDEVTVAYLAVRERGVVERVTDGGRTVEVVTEEGRVLRFRLGGSGHFVTADRSCRLIVE